MDYGEGTNQKIVHIEINGAYDQDIRNSDSIPAAYAFPLVRTLLPGNDCQSNRQDTCIVFSIDLRLRPSFWRRLHFHQLTIYDRLHAII